MRIAVFREEAFLPRRGCQQGLPCRSVGGDAMNCGAASRFIERPGDWTLPKDEFAQLTSVLQLLSETFEEVHCGLGNHVDRIRKFFAAAGIPPYMLFLVGARIRFSL